jgi:hypothetical protein
MEREKGFESGITHGFSGTYVAPENAPESPSRPLDASIHVSTEHEGGDTASGRRAVPRPCPELFLEAGLIVADRAVRALAGRPAVEEIVHRAVRHAAALRLSAEHE